MEMIQAFQDSASKGLIPEDYDSSRWPARILKLKTGSRDQKIDARVDCDLAMTIASMRFVSALHNGRVNPQHFNFDIEEIRSIAIPQ